MLVASSLSHDLDLFSVPVTKKHFLVSDSGDRSRVDSGFEIENLVSQTTRQRRTAGQFRNEFSQWLSADKIEELKSFPFHLTR